MIDIFTAMCVLISLSTRSYWHPRFVSDLGLEIFNKVNILNHFVSPIFSLTFDAFSLLLDLFDFSFYTKP